MPMLLPTMESRKLGCTEFIQASLYLTGKISGTGPEDLAQRDARSGPANGLGPSGGLCHKVSSH